MHRLTRSFVGLALCAGLFFATAAEAANTVPGKVIRPGRSTLMPKASTRINRNYQAFRRGYTFGNQGQQIKISEKLQFDVSVKLRGFKTEAAMKRSLKRLPLPMSVWRVDGTAQAPVIQGHVDTAKIPQLHRKGRVKSITFQTEPDLITRGMK